MKKFLVNVFTAFLVITCLTSCGNSKQYISVEKAKELAAAELDALDPADYVDCELVDLNLENKVYRVGGSDQEVAYLQIFLDAVTGDVIKSDSESLRCGKYQGYEKVHLSLNEVKQIIYEKLPGTSDLNIYNCYFELDDDEDNKALYYAEVITSDSVHDLTLDAVTGEVIEDYCKDDNAQSELNKFKEEFAEYLPENRFANANGQRPVWLLAHHCNDDYTKRGKIKENRYRDVYKGINSGCNGVEIDLSHRDSDNEIVVRHFPELIEHAESLDQFLHLPELNDERMTMVLYDIKDYKNNWIDEMVRITHNYYAQNPDNQKVHFIYSLSNLSKLKVKGVQDPYKRFRDIAPKLWPNEALAIDFENNQEEVRIMFDDIKFTRGVFGNGICSGRARGNIERSVKAAIVLRDKTGPNEDPYRFKAVNSWTVGRLKNKKWLFFYESVGLEERIAWGCDIVLLDGFKGLNDGNFNTFYGRELFNVNKTVRLATRADYPFGIRPEIIGS